MTVEFTLSEYRVKEDGTWLTDRPSIIRTGGAGVCSVRVSNSSSSTTVGRGTRDKDYTAASSTTINFASGETGIKYIDFQIIQDDLDEPDESIPLSLSLVSGTETLGTIKSSKVVILDDDEQKPPEPMPVKIVQDLAVQHFAQAYWGKTREVKYVDVTANFPENGEVPSEADLSLYLQEVVRLPFDANLTYVLLNCGFVEANLFQYLFIGEKMSDLFTVIENGNRVLCPSYLVNSRAHYAFTLGPNQAIWISKAPTTTKPAIRWFINCLTYGFAENNLFGKVQEYDTTGFLNF